MWEICHFICQTVGLICGELVMFTHSKLVDVDLDFVQKLQKSFTLCECEV